MDGPRRPNWVDSIRNWLLGEMPPAQEPLPRLSGDEEWDETAEGLLGQTKLSASQAEARAESLLGRAGALLGFCGAALALSAGTAKELLAQSRELGEPARRYCRLQLDRWANSGCGRSGDCPAHYAPAAGQDAERRRARAVR